MNDIIWLLIVTSIQMMCLSIFALAILDRKCSRNKKNILLIVLIGNILTFIGVYVPVLESILSLMLLPVLYKFIFRIEYKQCYIVHFLSFDILIICQLVLLYLSSLVLRENADVSTLVLMLFDVICLVFVVYLYYNQTLLQKIYILLAKKSSTIQVSFLALNIGIIFTMQFYRFKNIFWEYALLLLVFILALVVIVLVVLYDQLKIEVVETKVLHQKEMMEEIQEFVKENIRMQHENKNHLTAVFNAIEAIDDIEELRDELSKYQTDLQKKYLNEHKIFKKLDRVLVESLIIAKALKAESLGIHFAYVIADVTIESRIEDYVLCEILGCLFDNAFESGTDTVILHIYPLNEGKISALEVKNKHKELSNTFMQKMFKKGFTTKSTKKDHIRGYGLHNLNTILQTYNIQLDVYNELLEDENYVVFNLVFRSRGVLDTLPRPKEESLTSHPTP